MKKHIQKTVRSGESSNKNEKLIPTESYALGEGETFITLDILKALTKHKPSKG